MGQPNEEWNIDHIGKLLGEDFDIQGLFDNYARNAKVVCLEDFQSLCDAHGAEMILDNVSLLRLMNDNEEFMFYEGRDADGLYWLAEAITEAKDCPKCHCEPCECDHGGESKKPWEKSGKKKGKPFGKPFEKKEGKKRPPFEDSQSRNTQNGDKVISELQIRSPEEEANLYGSTSGGQVPGGDPHSGDMAPEGYGEYDERLAAHHAGEYDDMASGGFGRDEGSPFGTLGVGAHLGAGDAGMMERECPGCGYTGPEEECPECGVETMGMDEMGLEGGLEGPGGLGGMGGMGGMGELGGMGGMGGELGELGGPEKMGEAGFGGMEGGLEDEAGMEGEAGFGGIDDEDEAPPRRPGLRPDMLESREILTNPQIVECLKNFMASARMMIGESPTAKKADLAEALNQSWGLYASAVDARTCPSKVKATLQNLMKKYPGFNPIAEDFTGTPAISGAGMPGLGGSALTGGDGPKENLPKQPTETKEHGEKSLLGKEQVNKHGETPIIPNSGRGMTGKATNSGHGENVPSHVSESKKAKGASTKVAEENINKLTKYVKKQLSEMVKSIDAIRGKHKAVFSTTVAECDEPMPMPKSKKKKKTPDRDNLAEALADTEEILQLFDPENVVFNATFRGPNGQITLKQDLPLFTINQRGPIVSEGRMLFRFEKTAESMADKLVAEGINCRIGQHAWGRAVEAKTDYNTAMKAFQAISEKKKWMQDVKHTGECTPMTKSTCTGRKLAFAKRVQKGGDLHQGKGKKKKD